MCVTNRMQCVILAGGLGTRLASLTKSLPKALIPVAGRPFAEWQLTWLATEGVSEVVVCTGHLGHQIEERLGDGRAWGVEVTYSREGEHLLGTAGALRLAFDANLLEEEFFVLYGDSYLSVNLADMRLAFRSRGLAALMAVFRNKGKWGASNVVVRDGRVTLYRKNLVPPPREMEWIDYGICVVERNLIGSCVPPGQVVDLAPVVGQLAVEGQVAAYEVGERFYEIGSPTGLAELEKRLLSHGPSGTAPPSTSRVNRLPRVGRRGGPATGSPPTDSDTGGRIARDVLATGPRNGSAQPASAGCRRPHVGP